MNALFALFFSLLAPGAGHVFMGNFAEGICIGLLFALWKSALLPLGIRVLRITELEKLLKYFYVCNWLYILLVCYAVFSAFWRGFWCESGHFLYAILFAICVIVTYKNTFNRVIFTMLCGRTSIYDMVRNSKSIPSGEKEK